MAMCRGFRQLILVRNLLLNIKYTCTVNEFWVNANNRDIHAELIAIEAPWAGSQDFHPLIRMDGFSRVYCVHIQMLCYVTMKSLLIMADMFRLIGQHITLKEWYFIIGYHLNTSLSHLDERNLSVNLSNPL